MITSAVDIRATDGMIDVSRLGARGYDDFVRIESANRARIQARESRKHDRVGDDSLSRLILADCQIAHSQRTSVVL